MDSGVLQNDLTELLKILELPTHAQPASPHQVFQKALFELRLKMSELAVLKKQNAELQQALASTILPG